MGWQHALDVQLDTHKWISTDPGIGFTTSFFDQSLENLTLYEGEPELRGLASVALWYDLVKSLWRADTMFVTKDMQHLLMQAAHDLPEETAMDFHNLITPMGFCLFEETMYGLDRHGVQLGINAVCWNLSRNDNPEKRDGLAMYYFTDTEDQFDGVNSEIIPEMRKMGVPIPPLALMHFYPMIDGDPSPKEHPEMVGRMMMVEQIKLFIAMHLLAQQRIGEPERRLAPRAARKRFKREYNCDEDKMITLITLRRKSVKSDDDPVKVEWSHRWPVRGHWRRQWYPKTKTHDWVYIYEYIKGPEDKPLLVRQRRVFNFRR